MSLNDFPPNLRLLCSYGRSASDICRRIGINRQQFNKYLNGHSHPSMATLRRICDFFGVDEGEVLMNHAAFSQLIRLNPPNLDISQETLTAQISKRLRHQGDNRSLLERHEGYYFVYFTPKPSDDFTIRYVSRISRVGNNWFSKTIERHGDRTFAVPSTLKYEGLVLESHNRIVITEREQGMGRAIWSTSLIASDHLTPVYLKGMLMGISPEGTHEISVSNTIWQYLGNTPNLRRVVRECGVYALSAPELPEYVRNSDLQKPPQIVN